MDFSWSTKIYGGPDTSQNDYDERYVKMCVEPIRCESIIYEPAYYYPYKNSKASLKHFEQCRPCIKKPVSKYQICHKIWEKAYEVCNIWEIIEWFKIYGSERIGISNDCQNTWYKEDSSSCFCIFIMFVYPPRTHHKRYAVVDNKEVIEVYCF